MNEFNRKAVVVETAVSPMVLETSRQDRAYGAYIGLDVHKETIRVSIAEPGRGESMVRGEIANRAKSVNKLVIAVKQMKRDKP